MLLLLYICNRNGLLLCRRARMITMYYYRLRWMLVLYRCFKLSTSEQRMAWYGMAVDRRTYVCVSISLNNSKSATTGRFGMEDYNARAHNILMPYGNSSDSCMRSDLKYGQGSTTRKVGKLMELERDRYALTNRLVMY